MMSDEVLLDFCRALVSTVRSGLTLSDAFDTLKRSSRHGRMIARAAELTNRGAFLHEAFAAQGIFPPVFIALLRAGEEGGQIDDFLELYADCLEVRVKFRRQIERMLVYPLFVIVLAGALFLLVSFKVVPLVMEPLLKSGASLPPQAFFFSALAEALAANWHKLLVLGAFALLALRWLLRSGPGRKARGLAGHWLPLFRFATAEGRLYYIYTTIGLLLKAGLPLGSMMEVLLQFSRDDLVTRRRLHRASEMLAKGVSFSESVSGLMQEDDRRAMEIAEKAGRLELTMLARAKLHYDRHLHRMKVLATWFNISTAVAIALVCFALILTVAWPAISVMKGTKDPLRTLGLSTPGEGGGRTLPANSGGARRKKAPPLSLEDAKTKFFNEKYGQKAAEFMKQYGEAPARTKEAGGQTNKSSRKKLDRAAPIGKIRFNSAQPTSIQPSDINSH